MDQRRLDAGRRGRQRAPLDVDGDLALGRLLGEALVARGRDLLEAGARLDVVREPDDAELAELAGLRSQILTLHTLEMPAPINEILLIQRIEI